MKCLYCEKDFVLSGKQGGQNRLFCYNCLPADLERNTRNKIRRELYVKKASEEKKRNLDAKNVDTINMEQF